MANEEQQLLSSAADAARGMPSPAKPSATKSAAMDGDGIRDLSAEQHGLIGELVRAAFEAADVRNPSSTVRDDLTGTLQAAIADPDVRARLGRLAKPERWSGFGAFVDVASGVTAIRAGNARAEPKPSRPKTAKKAPRDMAGDRRREKLNATVTAAERAKAEADGIVSERHAEHAAAWRRRDQALGSLGEAERDVDRAEDRYDSAKQASRAAAALVKEAKAQLERG